MLKFIGSSWPDVINYYISNQYHRSIYWKTQWILKTFGVTWRTEKLVKHFATIEEAVFVEGESVNEHKTIITEIFH